MRTNHVAAPGARLFTRVDGDERWNAPWLVLSNSLAADHAMWDPQIAMLTRRYRVLRYDTRGHGASEAPAGPYDFATLVADLVAVMNHHGVERARVMGLSFGGMTGLGLALTHPGRVERLVCCDARADAPEPFRLGWDERVTAIDRGGMQAILAGTVERWLVPAFRAANPGVVAMVERMILGTAVEGYKGCAAALKELDYLKDLHRMVAPTLFVVGAHDAAAPVDAMRDMAGRVPGAQLAIVPDAAHLPNLDNAPAFADAISGFLDLS